MTNWETLLKPCECEPQYTIELHGDGYALYYGRCVHRHGWNLAYLKEPSANCDLAHIEYLINLGAEQYKKMFDDRDYNERFRTPTTDVGLNK